MRIRFAAGLPPKPAQERSSRVLSVLSCARSRAVRSGHGAAALVVGVMHFATPALARTPDEALASGLAAINANKTEAALTDLNEALNGGAVDAGFFLGRIVETGLGLQADFPKAFKLYQFAAARGSAKAMNRLGVLALEGKHVRQDLVAGRKLVCDAAAKKDTDAAVNCAAVLLDGVGGPSIPAQALHHYEFAAERGHILANLAAGSFHLKGTAGSKDLRRAQIYFEQAASRGNPIALFQIAQMFDAGVPVARDLGKAFFYYKLAAARGHDDALKNAIRLAQTITPQQAEAARIAASSWRAVEP